MELSRIEVLRANLELGYISYAETSEISDAFHALDPATLRDLPEHALYSDMLDELEDAYYAARIARSNSEYDDMLAQSERMARYLDTIKDGRKK